MTDQHPTYLEPSELGTKDYWETFYARTLSHLSSKQTPTTTTTTTTTTNTPHPHPRTKSTEATSSSSPDTTDDEEDEEDEVDDDSDPGTSWFSEHNAPEKVLDFLTDPEFPLAPCNLVSEDSQAQPPKILDLGTGNGSMLALLRRRGGFRGDMVGVDYSAQSVELARRLQSLRIHRAYLSDSEEEEEEEEKRGGEDGGKGQSTDIRFEEWDILSASDSTFSPSGEQSLPWFPYENSGFDIVLDKGTFDAVSLSADVLAAHGTEKEEEEEVRKGGKMVQRRVCERYPSIARGLVRPGGFLVVTSCNWTEEELVEWFTTSPSTSGDGDGDVDQKVKDKLVVWGRVEYPRFRFGGREGQGVCTVCFQRVVE
ncbi:putative S-adenosylmethionine-dependent methyltransferase [Aspergillus saccharolyticus JOP 1030-1]|uniref:Protein-lysine N-methyltransferase EFM4 n=1 Tax=Aspergillus saccharolyticus JOP 1030-1 TaxID=1450539 RepID=A0A318Z1Q2_9EURO|nr:hypothetical protein BP01DRAFT_360828 [Aspergillus saccharolyticus JOP 1030-1]PYH40956.1 hypothetical protein BP01DRAFT_360828 [Aspergillus saccharolyticus JOP 1030-1]